VKLIVCDASPLIVIAKSGLIPVLKGTAEDVIVPETVYAEATIDLTLPGAEAIRVAVAAGHIQFRPDVARPDTIPTKSCPVWMPWMPVNAPPSISPVRCNVRCSWTSVAGGRRLGAED